jgi:hypothetical protein
LIRRSSIARSSIFLVVGSIDFERLILISIISVRSVLDTHQDQLNVDEAFEERSDINININIGIDIDIHT